MKRLFSGCRSAAGHTRRRANCDDPGAVLRVPALRAALAALLLLGLAALAFAPPAFGQVITATFSPDTIDEGATETLTITYTRDCPGCDRVRFSNGSACPASTVNIGTIEFALSTSDPDTVTGTGSGSVTAGSVGQDTSCQPATQVHRNGTWFSGVSPSTFTIRNVVPAYSGAAVNGSTLTVSFTSALDTAHTPDTGDFTVSGGDSPSPTVTAVGFKSGDATKVELTLSRAVEYGETGVTLAYTPNAMDAKKLQDADEDKVAAFSGNAVTNSTPYTGSGAVSVWVEHSSFGSNPPNAPASGSATPGPGLGEITVTWTASASGSAVAQWRAFVKLATNPNFPSSLTPLGTPCPWSTTGRTCTITGLSNNTLYDVGLQLRVGGSGSANRIFRADDVRTRAGTDTTPPAYSSAAVNGNTLTVTFGEALDTAHVPYPSNFTVTGGDAPARTVTAAAFKTGDATKLELTLSRAVVYGETGVKVAYAKPGGVTRRLQDAAANEVAAFSNRAVTNATPYAPPDTGPMDFETPGTTSGTNPPGVPASATATPGPGDGQITVAWTQPTPGAISWLVNVRESGTARDFKVADGCLLQPATVLTCTATSLVAGTPYDLQLRLVRLSPSGVRDLIATNIIAKDSTLPAFSSAAVVGSTLTVSFSEALDTAHVPPADRFTVSGGDAPAPEVTAVAFKTGDATKLELTLDRPVLDAEGDLALEYVQPTPLQDRLQDNAGNFVLASTSPHWTVTNALSNPTVVSASVVDSTLTVTFSKALDTAHVPAKGQFTFPGVTPALAVQTVRFQPGDATKLVLSLSRGVLGNESGIGLKYVRPAPLDQQLQDAAGDVVVAGTFDVTVDSVAITSASVSGAALTLTANKPLDETFTPPNASFSVTARSPGGTTRTIAGAGGRVAISGRTVTVTLAEAVAGGEAVTAAYVPPISDNKPLIGMGGSGTPLPGFTGLVAPNTTASPLCTEVRYGSESTSPHAPSCEVAPGPGQGQITLVWTPAATGPAVARWHVSVAVAGSGSFTRVTDAAGLAAATRRIDLGPGHGLVPGTAYDVRLRAEGPRPDVDFRVVEAKNVVAAADTTAPKLLETGGLTVDGATLTLAYDEALDAAHVPNKLYFTVAVAGRAQAPRVTAVAIEEDGDGETTQVELTLSPAVRSGETVTLTYRKGHDPNPLQDAHDNRVADFSGRAVTNATAANVGPQVVSARVDASRTVMTVTFDEALVESSVPSLAALWAAADYDAAGFPTTTHQVHTRAISGSQVRMTFQTALPTGKEWRFHYRPDQAGSTPLRGKVSGDAVTLTFDTVLKFAEGPGDRPHVTAVAFVSTPTHPQTYGQGDRIEVQATFSEEVDLHRNIGAGGDRWDRSRVEIRLGPGRGTRWALYERGTGGREIVFAYTLQPTDMTPAGVTPGGVSVLENSLNQEFCRISRKGTGTGVRPSTPSKDDARCAHWDHPGLLPDPNHKVGNVGLMARDTDPPVLQGAVVLGKTLTLSFDETLDAAAVPDAAALNAGAFKVRVKRQGSTAVQDLPAKTLRVSGSRVVAALYDPAPHRATVTMKYVHPTDAAKRLKDGVGNEVAAFPGPDEDEWTPVRNNTPLAAVLEASVTGTALELTFDQDLDTDATPRNGAFRVTATADGQTRTINGAAGDVAIDADDERTVTVTLARPVAGGETVTARYTLPSGTAAKLEDASGNALAAFDGKSVFNATPPLPTVFAASVNGTALTLEFDRELDTASLPRNSAFRVTVTPDGGQSRTIAGASGTVAIDEDKRTVTVTLAQVVHGETVTARYTPPSGSAAKLLDASGNAVAAFEGEEVFVATTPLPSMYAAEVTGTALTLEFDRELDTDSAPRNGAFRVTATADGRSRTVAGAAGDVAIGADKRTVTVTLAQRVAHGETVTARYTPPSGSAAKLQDAATGYAVAAFDGEEVFNATAALASVLGASVDGTALALTFDRDLDTARLPRNTAFRVTATPAGGTARTIAGAAGTVAVDASKRRVAVTLARAVAHGETVTVRYTPPAGSAAKLQNAAGLALAAFDVDPVHNATLRIGTAMDFATPGTATGTNPPGVPASATATPGPGPGEITVTWTNPTSGPVPTSWNTYARPAGLNVGWGPYVVGPCIGKLPDGFGRTCTITGLDEGTAYDVRLDIATLVGGRAIIAEDVTTLRSVAPAPALPGGPADFAAPGTTTGATPPGVPASATARPGPGPGKITVTWTDPASGPAVALWYASERVRGTTSWGPLTGRPCSADSVSAQSRSCTITGLAEGTAYDVRLVLSAAGHTRELVAENVTTLRTPPPRGEMDFTPILTAGASPPDLPMSATATAGPGEGEITVTVTMADTAAPLHSNWTIRARGRGDAEFVVKPDTNSKQINGNVRTARFSGLTLGAGYDFRLVLFAQMDFTNNRRVMEARGIKPLAPARRAPVRGQTDFATPGTTNGQNPPDVPASATATSGPGAGEITVTWTDPASGPGVLVWDVYVRRHGVAGPFPQDTVVCRFLTSARSCTYTGLAEGTAYDVALVLSTGAISRRTLLATNVTTLRSVAPALPALPGGPADFATPGTTKGQNPPDVPASATATSGPGAGEITVTWTDPASGPGVLVWDVYVRRHGVAGTFPQDTVVCRFLTSARSCTYTGLAEGTAYDVALVLSTGAISRRTLLAENVTAGGGFAAPTVSDIALVSNHNGDGIYNIGEVIEVEVSFSEAVAVSGKPQIKLDLGIDKAKNLHHAWAEYASGSGTRDLTFAMTVHEPCYERSWTRWCAHSLLEPPHAERGVAVLANTLHLQGGQASITAVDGGAAAALGHPGLAHDARHWVDLHRPRLNDATISGKTVTLAFDEALNETVVPPTCAFTVFQSGWGINRDRQTKPRTVSIADNTVTLELTDPPVVIDRFGSPELTIAYDKHPETCSFGQIAGKRLTDPAGNRVTGFDNRWLQVPGTRGDSVVTIAREGEDMTFRVGLAEPAAARGTAEYETADGTATAGEDYVAARGTLTYEAGEQVKTVTVRTLRDRTQEGQETLILRARSTTLNIVQAHRLQRGAIRQTPLAAAAIVSDPGDDRTYGSGDRIRVRLTFAGAVDVNTAGGTPRLKIKMDPDYGEKWAAYAGGSGTASLDFAFGPVAAPNLAPRGVAVLGNTLEANGGTLRRAGTTDDMTLDHEGLGHDTNHKVDHRAGTAPELASAGVAGTALTLTFDEALDGTSAPAGSAFTVTATPSGGEARSVAGTGTAAFGADGRTVTVTLAGAVAPGETAAVGYAVPQASPLRGVSGQAVAAFSDQAAANVTADTTAPALASASVNGAALTLTFDEALDAESAPAGSAFTVTATPEGGGEARSVAGTGTAAFDETGRIVTVALAEAVAPGETLAAAYVVPDANPLRDLAANPVAAFSDQAAANATADTTAPALASASVDGAALTLTFDEVLDAQSAPAGSAFTVAATPEGGGEARSVAGTGTAAFDETGRIVTVALAEAVAPGETLAAAYVVPDDNPLRDLAENPVAAFSDQAAANATADTTAPALASASVDGAALTLTFDEALDAASAPAGSAFTVTATPEGGGEARSVAGTGTAAFDDTGRLVTVALAEAVAPGETLAAAYAVPDTNPLRDLAENPVAAFSEQAAANATAGPLAAVLTVAGAGTPEWFPVRVEFSAAVTGTPALSAGVVGGDEAAVTEVTEVEPGRAWTARVAASGPARVWVRAGAATPAAGGESSPETVLVVDVDAEGNATPVEGPAVIAVSIAAPANGRPVWSSGEEVSVTLRFSEPVTVETRGRGGTPEVGLTADGAPVRAAYRDGSGAALRFAWTAPRRGGVAHVALVADSLSLRRAQIGPNPGGARIGRSENGVWTDADLRHPGAERGLVLAEEPVTAAFVGPEAHGGAGAEFTLRVDLSRPADLRAFALGVVGGRVEMVTPMGSNDSWGVVVAVESDGAVTVTLAAREGGPALADAPSMTVPGPAPVAVPEGLTATFEDLPAEHDGRRLFRFTLAFSEDFAGRFDYRTLRDHAFQVEHGAVREAKRVAPNSNQRWTIAVRPASYEDITITLPAAEDCAAQGAVCTEAGEKLAEAVSATVPGPAAISVADARAKEGVDETIDFVVSLHKAAAGVVTVDYETVDGSAKAGEDYVAASGTLTFEVGETEKTVAVTVLDDAKDEGEETFRLRLSNAVGAYLLDRVAVGTIENADPLQQAWLARFGRTVGSQAIDAIGSRFEGGGGAAQVTIGGQTLALGGAAALEAADGAGAGADDSLRFSEAWRAAFGEKKEAEESRTMEGRELLLGSSFNLSAGGENGAPRYGAWGRFAVGSFDADLDGIRLSGEVTTGFLGADVESGRWLAGAALSVSEGEGPFTLTGAQASNRKTGTIESTLTSLWPYARLKAGDRLDLWAMAGLGRGAMTIDEDGGAPIETDIGMSMGAVGAKGALIQPGPEGGIALGLRTDAMWVRTESDAVRSAERGNLEGATAEVTRLRVILDASRAFALDRGGTLTPALELGLRQDGGDAETGTGVELGARLGYAADGVAVEGAVRGLLAHEDESYEEWGASASVRIDPGASGRGLSLTLAPAWGNAASGAERLWGARDAAELAPGGAFEATSRLDAELGYGFPGPYGLGTVTPYAGLGLAGEETRTWRTGARWQLHPQSSLGLEATRSTAGAGTEPEHGLMLRLESRW